MIGKYLQEMGRAGNGQKGARTPFFVRRGKEWEILGRNGKEDKELIVLERTRKKWIEL